MTTDLTCLLLLALWSIPLNHAPALGRASVAGLGWAMGNRETQPEVPDWVGRADRVQRNHHDNLAMIAVVILVAQVMGVANDTTATASIVILAARIAHGLFYIAGIGPLRSLSYVVALAAMVAIAWQCLAPLVA
ncbi:MAG: MAPEG family protein [Synechococcales cyanobacterium RM1_1_8]|nr:MAPEG family protein [Synechococcales cyanobacterium RM1_1_8]